MDSVLTQCSCTESHCSKDTALLPELYYKFILGQLNSQDCFYLWELKSPFLEIFSPGKLFKLWFCVEEFPLNHGLLSPPQAGSWSTRLPRSVRYSFLLCVFSTDFLSFFHLLSSPLLLPSSFNVFMHAFLFSFLAAIKSHMSPAFSTSFFLLESSLV